MENNIERKRINYSYIVIPLITLAVIVINWFFKRLGLAWYNTLSLPFLMPSSRTISVFWWLVYIPTTIAAFLVWNTFKRNFRFWVIIFFFAINVVLNILWNYLFFYQHLIGVAFIESISLTFSILVLILFIQPVALYTALLLYPYLIWASFVTYLNYMVWLIN